MHDPQKHDHQRHDHQTHSQQTPDDLAHVVRLEILLLSPQTRADPERVRSLLHPDFVEFGASGRVWDRDSITEALAADPRVTATGTDFVPVRLADDAVLLTFRVGDSLRSSVWLRDPVVGWRIRFHQGTPTDGPDSPTDRP